MPESRPVLTFDARLCQLEERHQALLAEIVGLGLCLRGTIGTYAQRCGKPDCHCHADPPRLHGPYSLWTRKVASKSVTVHLRPNQVAQLQAWNRNMHRLDRCVRELQALGYEAAQAFLDAS